ncbi:hypothetical protein PHYC_00766 [Phycisphaerales bacterium]|nr:hypothetical protein PHYC_00766 [Phycisphaerales bacterium]
MTRSATIPANPRVLEGNLRALGVRSARAAAAIRHASADPSVELTIADDGGVTGTLARAGVTRQLASRRGPIAEGEKLAAGVDVLANAAVVVMGLGLGHHVAALARRLKQHGAIVVFEPDVALLRALLERVDMTAWLRPGGAVLLTDPDDTGSIAEATRGIEAVLATGTVFLDHPPSVARLGVARDRFAAAFANVMKAVRTNVVTTLVQVDVTVRNLLQNARWYATVPGVAELVGSQRGRPAVVVAAGPSLRRNIDLLARPELRERVVVIAVQTVLKQLLARGIRPDYVTALDYHEISARFYEGLTAGDVEGVTLVVEPKANPAILEAFPGKIRCVGDDTSDKILGPALHREMGRIQPGATVAHLAYYLARHLGCDPVILVGQDLGFTDGQYYGPGAAIHQVWAGELNEFNTLEMLEWQRIARMRSLLRKATDVHGREIYTDEQMSTYLVQFERDFLRDKERQFTTIDATEGGVRKQHATVMSLAKALEMYGNNPRGDRPARANGPTPIPAAPRLRELEARFQELRRGAGRIAELGRRAEGVLREMLADQSDQARVNELIARVNEIGVEAAESPAYWLVQHINQTGQLNRYKADRAIGVDDTLSGFDRQRKEIERDIRNVNWLADAATLVTGMLDEALVALKSGKARTREVPHAGTGSAGPRRRVWACVLVDHERGGLGISRDLSRPFLLGHNPLQLLLARLARCARLEGVLLHCLNIDAAKAIAGHTPTGLRVEFTRTSASHSETATRVAAGRAWARHCWRGGLANLSCYDEVLDAPGLASEMVSRGIDAAVVLGADWALADPRLIDEVIERHEERPDGNAMTFTQAAPGLAGCLLARSVVEEMARVGGSGATVGALLGYHPVAPQGDPIAKPACVSVPPSVRDALMRCIPDTHKNFARLAEALRPLGDRVLDAGAAEIAAALRAAGLFEDGPVEAVTMRLRFDSPRGLTGLELRHAIGSGDSPAVTFVGDGCDVLDVPGLTELVASAKAWGAAAVHIRTALTRAGSADRRALSLADVVSVDLLAESATAYLAITDREGFDTARSELARLVNRSLERPCGGERNRAWPSPWVVPRITRRDEVFEQVESFYNRWLLGCGACVIDPLPRAIDGARIEPLPLPAPARRRMEWSRVLLDSRGTQSPIQAEQLAEARA